MTQLHDPAPAQVAGFRCSEAPDLRDFLVEDAAAYVRQGLAHVYLGWRDVDLVGFFALSCGALRYEELSRDERRKAELGAVRIAVPGVLLGRLVVDERFRAEGIGTWLFPEAVGIAKFGVASSVGCRFLFLDAKYERIDWYEKMGCRVLGDSQYPPSTTRMGFDLYRPE